MKIMKCIEMYEMYVNVNEMYEMYSNENNEMK